MEVQSLSPAVLGKVLKDVTDIDFDINDSTDLAAARVVAQKLMNDPVKSELLAAKIAISENHELAQVLSLSGRYRGKALKISPTTLDVNDRILADAPDDAANPRVYYADLLHEETLASTGPQHRFIFPEVLGFHSTAHVRWSQDTIDKWHNILRAASDQVPDKWYTRLFELKKHSAPEVHRLAQNYAVCRQSLDRQLAVSHFLFEVETLYVVVSFSGVERSRFQISFSDIDALTTQLSSAFEGHPDAARLTLLSLSETISN